MIKLFARAILLCVLCLSASAGYSSPTRRALVIGNDSYPGNELRNARNDGRSVADKLSHLGYVTTLVLDVDLPVMSDAFTTFGKSIEVGDIVIVYYAGHGLQVNGENYLVPVDFHVSDASEVRFKAYSLGQVLETLTMHGAGTQIVILDACRNNPFLRSRGVETGWASIGTSAGTLLGFGTTPGSTASDSSTEMHGLFTNALLKYMDDPKLDIETMLRMVRREVIQVSNGTQVPWMSTSLIGTLHLVPSADLSSPSLSLAREKDQGAVPSSKILEASRHVGVRDITSGRGTQEGEILERAIGELRGSHLEDAMGLLKQVLSLDPRCSLALRLLGIALHLSGRVLDARAVLDQAIILNPHDARALAYRCLVTAGHNASSSIEDCKNAAQLDHNLVEPRVGLVVDLISWDRYREAVEETRRLVSLIPVSPLSLSLDRVIADVQLKEATTTPIDILPVRRAVGSWRK